MITKHPTLKKAHDDAEFWVTQGFDVSILLPDDEKDITLVYVRLCQTNYAPDQ